MNLSIFISFGSILILAVSYHCDNTLDDMPIQLKCSSDEYRDCVVVEADQEQIDSDNSKNKREVKDFLMRHPNLIKKMHRYASKSDNMCSTKKCLIDNLFRLASRKIYRKSPVSLTCVGDPYANHGIKCVPIEGLFIGK